MHGNGTLIGLTTRVTRRLPVCSTVPFGLFTGHFQQPSVVGRRCIFVTCPHATDVSFYTLSIHGLSQSPAKVHSALNNGGGQRYLVIDSPASTRLLSGSRDIHFSSCQIT